MRRSASEIVRNLEMRVARLERKASSSAQIVMDYFHKGGDFKGSLRGGKMSKAGHLYIDVDGVSVMLGADEEDILFVNFDDEFEGAISSKDLNADKYVVGGRVNINALERDVMKLYRTI